MTLGQRIKKARLEKGLTQSQLVGDQITRNMLSKIENDSATPSVKTLQYLADRLDLPPGYFITDSRWSDGTSPDGLDNMRAAYREGRFTECIRLLENNPPVGTTDEGYLLRSLASLSAAREALERGDWAAAKEYADAADYYNKQGIYYSTETDAEMSLILAECALRLDAAEFEENAQEYLRAVGAISFNDRYELARARFALTQGRADEALATLTLAVSPEAKGSAEWLYLSGAILAGEGNHETAVKTLSIAEELAEGNISALREIYEALELSYKALGDFAMAYHYASKQLR